MTGKLYTERRFLRKLEQGWVSFEGVINRFVKSDFNPFYHLGTLTIFMLVVLNIEVLCEATLRGKQSG